MSDQDRRPAPAAALAAAIARLATELSLAEEPAGFVVALEADPDARDAREHHD